MQEGQPSRTALGAAVHRAAHQTLDRASIFRDPLARAMLGREADALIEAAPVDPFQQRMRIFLATRSRFAEDCLEAAVARGVRQLVVLGAGLDTFSLRNPHADVGLNVFEVDHPSTQAWKRARLAEAGLAMPKTLTFVPVDFATQRLSEALDAAGFSAVDPAFFYWLGVVPYLSRDAISAVLGYVGGLPQAEIVFDYALPREDMAPERRAEVAALAARTAALGEPLITFFRPADIAQGLSAHGFTELEDVAVADLAVRYLRAPARAAGAAGGPRMMRARRI